MVIPASSTTRSDGAQLTPRVVLVQLYPQAMDAHRHGRILELAMDPASRRQRGRHFTAPEVARWMAEHVQPRAGGRVLDPACGAGALLAAAGERGAAELWGVDIDGEALEVARRTLPAGTHLIEGDFLTLSGARLGGPFDAVVANPPYLRQESIRAARKRALRARFVDELALPGAGRVDLLGYFLIALTRHLRHRGRLAFLSSAAWLTSRYGAVLRSFVTRHYSIERVLESAVEPWFPEARTRAVLLLARRLGDGEAASPVHFVRLDRPAAEPMPSGREVPPAQLADGRPWGGFLRTPAALDGLHRRLPDAFCALGELVEARFGVKTGADRFFLFRDGVNGLGQVWEGPAGLLRPIVVSPMDLDRLTVDPERLPRRLLLLRPEDADDPRVARLLGRAEGAPHPMSARATCAGRERRDGTSRWYTVPPGGPAPVLWTRTVQYRHLVAANPEGALVNNNLIALQPREGIELAGLLASLNSGWTFLERYAHGRVSNEGKVKTEVGDLPTLRVPDPRRLAGVGLDPIEGRPIGRLDRELERPDRRAFEGNVLTALGLPAADAEAWLERLAAAVHAISAQERRWEAAYRRGKGRPPIEEG